MGTIFRTPFWKIHLPLIVFTILICRGYSFGSPLYPYILLGLFESFWHVVLSFRFIVRLYCVWKLAHSSRRLLSWWIVLRVMWILSFYSCQHSVVDGNRLAYNYITYTIYECIYGSQSKPISVISFWTPWGDSFIYTEPKWNLYAFIIQIANTILNQCILLCLYKIGHIP